MYAIGQSEMYAIGSGIRSAIGNVCNRIRQSEMYGIGSANGYVNWGRMQLGDLLIGDGNC